MSTTPIEKTKALLANMYTVVAVVPSTAISATVNIRLLTRNLGLDAKIRLAICDDTFTTGIIPPSDDSYIHAVDLILGPTGIQVGFLEDTAVVIGPGRCVVAWTDTACITARVHGFLKTSTVP